MLKMEISLSLSDLFSILNLIISIGILWQIGRITKEINQIKKELRNKNNPE